MITIHHLDASCKQTLFDNLYDWLTDDGQDDVRDARQATDQTR